MTGKMTEIFALLTITTACGVTKTKEPNSAQISKMEPKVSPVSQSATQNSTLVLSLTESFPNASVVNINWNPLARDWETLSKNWNVGGAGSAYLPGLVLQDGTKPQGPALFVVPPIAGTDFTKVIFKNVKLDSAKTWYLNFKVGLLQPSIMGDGVELQIVAEGQPFLNRGAPWKVLSSITVLPGNVQQISVPLGLWPLRESFGISFQVSSRSNNIGDLVLLDNPKIDAGPNRPELGLQRSNIEWENTTVADKIYSEVAPLSPKWVRLAVRGSALKNNLVYHAKKVKQLGAKLHLIFISDAEDADNPANPPNANVNDATFNRICGWNSGALPISAVNLSHYKTRIETHLNALKANGIVPDSVEVGNELDWFCFNGDIPSSGIISDPSFSKTISKYAEILKTTYLSVTANSPTTKVITFGYANIPPAFSTSAINPIRFLNALKNVGGINFLEKYTHGVGVHMYNAQTMWGDFWDCANAAAGKPVWVTEFGVTRTSSSGWDRYDAYMNLLEMFNSTWQTQVPMILPYAYETPADFSFIDKQTRTLDPVGNIYFSYRP